MIQKTVTLFRGKECWLPILAGILIVTVTLFLASMSVVLAVIIMAISVITGVSLSLSSNTKPVTLEDHHKQIEQLSTAISKVIEVTNRQIESTRTQTEEAITEMTVCIGIIIQRLNNALNSSQHENISSTDSSEFLKTEGKAVLTEINSVLVSLQFQDRTSQILGHVYKALNELSITVLADMERIEKGERSLLDVDTILCDLERSYTTDEERRLHRGEIGNGRVEASVDFF